MSGDAPVRVALVGLGEHGTEVLLPALRISERAELVAVCDVDHNRIEASRSVRVPSFTSVDQLLAEIQPDALVLAGPPQMHTSVGLQALQHGISVFIEKPPAIDSTSLAALVEAAEARSALVTGVGLNFRYADPIQLILEYMRRYDLIPIYVSVKHTSSKPRNGLWGLDRIRAFLLAQAIHPLDTLILVGGGGVVSCHTESYFRESDMTISVNLRFNSGCIGHLMTGTDSPKFENTLEIVTSEDVVFKLDNMWNLQVLDERFIPSEFPDKKRWNFTWAPSPLNSGFGRSGYARELEEFFSCVAESRAFSPSLADSVELYSVLDEIDREMRQGVG